MAGSAHAPQLIAEHVLESFRDYHARFRGIARRSKELFETREWRAAQAAARERLLLYRLQVDRTVQELRGRDPGPTSLYGVWAPAKAEYARLTEERHDAAIARTFFNSVSRRLTRTVGVHPETEFLGQETLPTGIVSSTVDPDVTEAHAPAQPRVTRAYRGPRITPELMQRVLLDAGLSVRYRDLGMDARLVAAAIAQELAQAGGSDRIEAVEVIPSLFFRNKGAYLVARILRPSGAVPLILPLLNGEAGVYVDAVLMSPDEASGVFGFSWSYFHVDVPRPKALVDFLRSLMPHKRVDELYTSIGYNKHGKTLLYQSLREHLARPGSRFEMAEGVRGMVMSVFTLPSLNVVFKVIKDRFAPPKRTNRRRVQQRYRLVFLRDRVGRLADVQEFEGLEFRADQFAPEVLAELREDASSTIRAEGDAVVIDHLYTQRRLTPLDLYLRQALASGDGDGARRVVLDYGQAVKDLAAANTFPGDLLLKNFGVTRHGRVVFYDYDEITPLTECFFRRIPRAVHEEDELAAEPWFHVGERDMFPEEFPRFLALPDSLKAAFMAAHDDLFGVGLWQGLQRRARDREVVDFFPYPQSRRLQRP